MNVGKAVEQAVIETMKIEGLYVDSAVPFQAVLDGVPIAGEIDAVFLTEPCGTTRYVVEVKSHWGYHATKELFGKYLRLGKEPGKPKDTYLMQIALYLYYFSRLPPDDPRYLPFGAIFVCDRGDGHFGVYDVWLEEETKFLSEDERATCHRITYASPMMDVPETSPPYTVQDILRQFRICQDALEKGTPPPRPHVAEYDKELVELRYEQGLISKSAYERWMRSHGPRGKGKERLGDWQCRLCPWKSTCWEGEEG